MKRTADAHLWAKKWSTWLALASASAGAALAAYAVLPARAQDMVPAWALGSLSAITIICALLIPLATSLSQASIEKGTKGG